MEDNTISDSIKENATNPQYVQEDGIVVRQQPLLDQIEVDKYLSAKEGLKKWHRGIYFSRLTDGGC